MILSFIYSPIAFFKALIWNIIILSITLLLSSYFVWIDYRYAKYLTSGRKEIVTGGIGDESSSAQRGPNVEINTMSNLVESTI